MAKTYVCVAGDGSKSFPTGTQSSGSQKHLVSKGPTLGYALDYSGAVNGSTTLYLVDNGPTLGRSLAAS